MKTKLLIFFIAFCGTVNAQYTKLVDFSGTTNGTNPHSGLISEGTFLYGMTAIGGANNMGTVFKIMPNGLGYIKLLDFAGAANGRQPYGNLFSDGTFLYGMTFYGGTNDQGTIFKIMHNGTGYIKLLDFNTNTNGAYPYGSLISDGTFLYGMTSSGGINAMGTLFKIMTNGTGYVKLLDFSGVTNGREPTNSLVSDGAFLYGVTRYGGSNDKGTIFKIMSNGTGYVKLIDFTGTANGSQPYGALISDGTFLYGTTIAGGTTNWGTVFKIMPDGTGYVKLHDFAIATNGRFPYSTLILDNNYLYGMTFAGGTNNEGTLFKIMPNGTGYAKLVDFAGVTTGSSPIGALISDGSFLYGSAVGGGINGMGTLFKYQDNTLNITENNEKIGFTIYPNPLSATTTLQTNVFLNNATLTVYNLSGQQVKKLENISGQTITFNRENLTEGFYFIQLMLDNKIIATYKLVIMD